MRQARDAPGQTSKACDLARQPRASEHESNGDGNRGRRARLGPNGYVRLASAAALLSLDPLHLISKSALAGRADQQDGGAPSRRPPGGLPHVRPQAELGGVSGGHVEGCPRAGARSDCVRSTGWHWRAGWRQWCACTRSTRGTRQRKGITSSTTPTHRTSQPSSPTSRDGPRCYQSTPRTGVRDEEVAGSNPVTPTIKYLVRVLSRVPGYFDVELPVLTK
jgi:hypothetical protein